MTYRFHRFAPVLFLSLPSAAFALGLGEIHVNSALNQPLVAQIELVGPTPEELTQLRASVAGRETFQRYGVDRPSFLSSISFKVGTDSAGRPVLVVRSADVVTEPFVTFLIDVSWAKGKLTREYTLLLDPPVFATPANTTAPAVIRAPQTGGTTAQQPEPIRRRAEAVATTPSTDSGNAQTYRVMPNDTLLGIARRTSAGNGVAVNRTMTGIFKANTAAFVGNINRLRSGAQLAIPGTADLAAISQADIEQTLQGQFTSRKANSTAASTPKSTEATAGAAPAATGARLRLVSPTAAADNAAATAVLQGKVESLESELGEIKRMLALKDSELARLQQAAGKPVPGAAPPAAANAPAVPEVAPAPVVAPATPPASVNPTPVTPPVAAKPVGVKAPVTVPASGIWDTLQGLWLPVGGALAVVAAALAAWALRKRRAPDFAETMDRFEALQAQDTAADVETQAHSPVHYAVPELQDTPVVADSVFVAAPMSAPVAPAAAVSAAVSSPAAVTPVTDSALTMSNLTSLNLEYTGPLAEADFHMAYGLYDQAADIVKMALEHNPERRDLRLKLLEVYFVSGNKAGFVELAHGLHADAQHADPSEWEKIAIMGRQIAPEDALFADGQTAGDTGAVDLDLADEGHDQVAGMDLEFIDEDDGSLSDSMDLDLEHAFAGHLQDETATHAAVNELDFHLDAAGSPASGGVPATHRDEMDPMENTHTLDVTSLSAALPRQPVDAGLPDPEAITSSTVIDRIKPEDRARLEAAALAPTTDDLSAVIEKLNASTTSAKTPDLKGLMELASETLNATQAGETTVVNPVESAVKVQPESSDTRLVPQLDLGAASPANGLHEIDFDLEQLAASLDQESAHSSINSDGDLDRDFGFLPDESYVDEAQTARHKTLDSMDLDLQDLEPVTLSEVGTKIDLARAYIDMGDPDGARSILNEVVDEGSASQRAEAQRLLADLAG